MPTAIASATPANFRRDLAFLLGTWRPGTTTAAGSTTSAVDSSLAGDSPDEFVGRYLAMTSGPAAVNWRRIIAGPDSTGQLDIDRAYGAATGSGDSYEIHLFRPDLYTMACNEAIRRAFADGAIYAVETDYLLGKSSRKWYGLPPSMTKVFRVLIDPRSEKIDDKFDRAASTTTPGGRWTVGSGTWGITSESLYNVSNTNGHYVHQDPDLSDGVIWTRLLGTLNSATDYSTALFAFRVMEDRNGDIDFNNYLSVQLVNSSLVLYRTFNGTTTALNTVTGLTTADNTWYEIRILFVGNHIRVWVDDVERISYRLTGENLRYLDGKRVAIVHARGVNPTYPLRVDNYRVHAISNPYEINDWEVDYDQSFLRFDLRGYHSSISDDALIILEGGRPLTTLPVATTWGNLPLDTTATLEIETTDPAWELLLWYGAAALYEQAAQRAVGLSAQERQEYLQQAAYWQQRIRVEGTSLRMRKPAKRLKVPS